MAQSPSYESRGICQVIGLYEAASQTFKKGAFLTVDTNGRVQQAVSAGSRLGAASGNITNRIIGRAEQDASGTTGRIVDVMIAEPGTWFALPVDHATPGSAVPNTNLIGAQVELLHHSAVAPAASYYAASLDNTTNKVFKIMDMYIPDHTGWDPTIPGIATAASATQYGKVWVEFLNAATIGGGA